MGKSLVGLKRISKGTELSQFTEYPQDDPGDFYDPFKWNFPENSLISIRYNGHIYKLNHLSNLEILVYTRKFITELCKELARQVENGKYTKYKKNIKIFMCIHNERKPADDTSCIGGYLLSEIPVDSKVGSIFEGLNKPKGRHLTDEPDVGKDKNLRAAYRDIFLDLSVYDSKGPEGFIKLVVHELAHTFANHLRYRSDDHGKDFVESEKVLLECARNIGLNV